MTNKKSKQSDIGTKLAQEMFEKLGLDSKGRPIKAKASSIVGDYKRSLGESKSGTSYQSHNSPLKSSYFSPTKPPFRIRALEKTRRQSPKGKAYQYSALYRNAVILRLLIKKFTDGLDPKKHNRLISQLDSAARSVVANIREGYLRPTSAEYSTFLGFSQGSLEEVKGDIEDAKDDELLPSRPGSSLAIIGIELKPLNPPAPKAQSPLISSYDPLGEHKRIIREIKREDLTYEIFIELINKTDYLLKRAVDGLDKKIISDEERKLKQKLGNRRYY